MGLQAVGTAITSKLFFNSGIVTVDGTQLTEVQDITVNPTFDIKELKAIGTIKLRAIRRANFKIEVTFNIKTFSTAINKLFYSASSPSASGTDYTVKDGQQTASTGFYITGYDNDDVTHARQFQIANPIISVNNNSQAIEDFNGYAVTVIGTDVTEYVATLTEN
jgi:sporulation protein YlmC with PRC-barrel domain